MRQPLPYPTKVTAKDLKEAEEMWKEQNMEKTDRALYYVLSYETDGSDLRCEREEFENPADAEEFAYRFVKDNISRVAFTVVSQKRFKLEVQTVDLIPAQ